MINYNLCIYSVDRKTQNFKRFEVFICGYGSRDQQCRFQLGKFISKVQIRNNKYVMPLRFVKKTKSWQCRRITKISRSNTLEISNKLVRLENSKSESFGISKKRAHSYSIPFLIVQQIISTDHILSILGGVASIFKSKSFWLIFTRYASESRYDMGLRMTLNALQMTLHVIKLFCYVLCLTNFKLCAEIVGDAKWWHDDISQTTPN